MPRNNQEELDEQWGQGDKMVEKSDPNQREPGFAHKDEEDRRPTAGNEPNTRAKGKSKANS